MRFFPTQAGKPSSSKVVKLGIIWTFSILVLIHFFLQNHRISSMHQYLMLQTKFLIKERVFYLDYESDQASNATWTHSSLYFISTEVQCWALMTTVGHNACADTTPMSSSIPCHPHSWKSCLYTPLLQAATRPQLEGFNPPHFPAEILHNPSANLALPPTTLSVQACKSWGKRPLFRTSAE